MNRRTFFGVVPAVALAASPAVAAPKPITPQERLKLAIAEIEKAFNELYPDLKVVRHLNEVRDIDQYYPTNVMLAIIAEA